MIPWNNAIYSHKKIPGRPLVLPPDCFSSAVSARSNLDCIPTLVSQLYPHLSKVFDNPLNDKALKIFNTFTSEHLSYNEVPFLTAQSVAYISTKLHRSFSNTKPEYAYRAQNNPSAKVCDSNSVTEIVIHQSTNFQRTFKLIKQNEETFEPFRVIISGLSNNEFLSETLQWYHAAFFSCANLQMSPKTMQYFFNAVQYGKQDIQSNFHY